MPGTGSERLGIPVDVRADDGRWYPGILDQWRRREGAWEGWVHYTRDVGMSYVDWVDANRLRPATWHYPDKREPDQGP